MHLEFEKPIVELESKLADMKLLAQQSDVDVSAAITKLEEKIVKLKEDTFENLTRWQKVQLSRHPERPYTLDYIYEISDDFIELHGDRTVKDDKAMVGGFAKVDGLSVMIIGQQKGRNTKQRQERNFGMANPEGYRKALRLMKLAEKFNTPVITLIDTPGAFPGIEAEERGQGEAIARNLKEMMTLTVPIVSVVIGEGASGGALGIAIADKVLMMENTWYSVISPESCSSILWRSWDYKEQAAEALKLTAKDMLQHKLIDGIIKEPLGGAHTDMKAASKELKKEVVKHIKSLEKLSVEKRIAERIDKFSNMGVVA
ncbi:acetyl-CoA carboxylase carboxyltransferase subunit alpha [Marinoscillum sp. 108]|uniref:acetyl-CoA carboxylase carboxyltransferase subunit alpha n=1 Tax=Marinoscillum sp. 108 TaxID=2653151 RepID=UPI0012F25B04|nr:acetyl-CoA carboxylase carboxyltransferase subunit alpha [Marinoscillum sp. 108]VXD12098.1 acetyl-CoA carboxylase, carboxytransferase, alpha subunit [Marinoscillum sp. 108]